MEFLRSNTAVIKAVGPFFDKTDGVTLETALTITNERITLIAETDAGSAPTIILDNITGATSGTANDLNYITGQDNGMMQIEFAAADVNRVGGMKLTITDAANHVPVFHHYFVLPQAIFDWLTGVIVPLPANVTQWLGTAAATPTVAGVPEVDVTHLVGVAQSATDLKDFADDGYDPSTNKVQGVVLTDTVTTYTGNTPQTGDSFARLGAPAGASVSADIAAIEAQTDDIGVAGAGLTNIPAGAGSVTQMLVDTTITGLIGQQLFSLTAGSTDDNAYNGCLVIIEDASNADQKCVAVGLAYAGTGKLLSLQNDPGIFTIADGDRIIIFADRAVHPTTDNATLDIDPTGTVGIDWGNIENKTTANVLSGTTIGVVTLLNGLAANVISAASIAAAALSKIADGVLRRKQANVEASSDGDAIADAGSLYGMVQQVRQSNTVDNAGFLTVYETDGTTELEQLPLDTDAAADPIVGVG